MNSEPKRISRREKEILLQKHQIFSSGLAFSIEMSLKTFLSQARSTEILTEDQTAHLYESVELLSKYQKEVSSATVDLQGLA